MPKLRGKMWGSMWEKPEGSGKASLRSDCWGTIWKALTRWGEGARHSVERGADMKKTWQEKAEKVWNQRTLAEHWRAGPSVQDSWRTCTRSILSAPSWWLCNRKRPGVLKEECDKVRITISSPSAWMREGLNWKDHPGTGGKSECPSLPQMKLWIKMQSIGTEHRKTSRNWTWFEERKGHL